MPRPAKFDEDTILDAALEEGIRRGFERLSASNVAARLGAPSGSLYHRYRSRDALVADLWLRTVGQFQSGYINALTGDKPPETRARAAARYVFDWAREHKAEAELLLRYRREDLLQGDMPASVSQRAASLNEPAARALREFAGELSPDSPDVERVRFACVTVPMAAVRESLVSGKQARASVLQLVDETVAALLERKD